MKPYRREKLGSSIQEVVSETILHRLHDPRISPFTTVTRVELTGDLLIGKVFISVMGTEAEERRTMEAILHAAGHIQRIVAAEVQMRLCPHLRFELDESVKFARHTLALIEENRRLSGSPAEAGPGAAAGEADEEPDGPEGLDDEADPPLDGPQDETDEDGR